MQIQEEKTIFYRPKWELKPKGSPHPFRRWCHTTTIHGGYLYIMGGRLPESAKPKDFVYRVNCDTFLCEPVLLEGNPMMRESHSSCLVGDSMHVLFGISKAGEVLNDCLQLKIDSNSLLWRKKNQNPQIQGRESHMSLMVDNRYILIYGGINKQQKLINDFYLYDLERETWKKIDEIQGAIQGKVGGTLINIKNQIYLFGGQISDDNQYSNQIYKIQIRNYKDSHAFESTSIIITKLNVIGSKPLPRSQFASVAFKDRYLIVIGGQGPNKDGIEPAKLFNDVWAFDTQKLAWEEIIPQNSNFFKPRSSFTANVYKDSVILFGGLVAFKDFRSSDEIFVLNLSTETEKKPLCNLCKCSFKMAPQQEIQVERSRGVKIYPNFNTSFSTISAIANTIPDPFTCLGTLFHSFDPFNVQKCTISLDNQKMMISLIKIKISDIQWRHILQFYEFIPLIQERDQRIRSALRNQIRQNFINYLSYNIKNCCLRLGNEFMISWINSSKELEIFLLNKFGVYHTMNLNVEQKATSSPRSIILQHLKENNIKIADLYHNQMTLCVTLLKNNILKAKELKYSPITNDILYNDQNLKAYLQTAFAKKLSFQLAILPDHQLVTENQFFKIGQTQKDKWPQQNNFPDYIQKIYTYESQDKSLLLVYQNNKLMHRKEINEVNGIVFDIHLTKSIQPNLTFSDVRPTHNLLNAIKTLVSSMNSKISNSLKRQRSFKRQKNIISMEEGKIDQEEPKIKKTVKTNETDHINFDIEFDLSLNDKKDKSSL